MLTGVHFLLTYTCNLECDHCFLFCGPWARGTFTIGQVTDVLDEAHKMGTVEWIFFEGGEPLLYYPLLKAGIERATAKGMKTGLVTNGYAAVSEEDAELVLKPLAEAGLTYISISNDAFHYGSETDNPAAMAYRVAQKLGMDTSPIAIEPPEVQHQDDKGEPIVGGGAMFRGRAVDKLTADLPRRPCAEMVECPYEELESPSRVHVDPYGNVHICQGISMGNMWKTPLSDLVGNYDPHRHPICGPLIRGGPAELAKALKAAHEDDYIDECHFCYATRRASADRLPEHLAPAQVYGNKPEHQ